MHTRFAQAREAFWFLPAVLGLCALGLAQALIALDRSIDGVDLGPGGALLYRVGASGSRDILGAIGGSMLAVAATSFSITISVLATASSTYGPRLVRNFMADRRNQFVLGVFGSTFLYALTVLRSIRAESTDGAAFVPDIAVNVAVLLAVLDVAVLVYFIHHIADSIQVSTLSARVRTELVAVVDLLYPEQAPANAVDVGAGECAWSVGPSEAVAAERSGFVVGIDENAILTTSSNAGCVVEILVRPGDHVVAGEAVARVRPPGRADDVGDATRSAVTLGDARTPREDVSFAVQQLTEMAVRALSPSTNDPYTAQNALAELAVGLVPMARRPSPLLGRVDDSGALRLIVGRTPATDILDDVFDAMRSYALEHPIALAATVKLAERIGIASADEDVRATVVRQLEQLLQDYRSSNPGPAEMRRISEHMARAHAAIGHNV